MYIWSVMVVYTVHKQNPQHRYIETAGSILKDKGGIAVYPTDTVYGMGACISNAHGIDKISHILEKDKNRLFSFLCCDFSQAALYARISNNSYRVMKRYLPGPYTFVLPATMMVPKKICPKRKTVGIRIPSCKVTLDLVTHMGEPIANTSIQLPGELRGDPEEVKLAVLHEVDIMLDIGPLDDPLGSTIVDLTDETPVLLRQGKGVWSE
jgi:tRNA threonylcarbamoyl adenosine modification protein (Sua5/YciO/YrdC/YwlC family)